MALSLVNLGTPTAAAASPWTISVALPSGVADDDLLVAHIQASGSGGPGTISGPAGWTQLGTQQASGNAAMAVFYKLRTGGEAGPYSFSINGGTPYVIQGWINAVRSDSGVPWPVAYAQATDSTNDTSCYIPAITMSSDTVQLWGVVCLDRNDRWVDAAPSGYTLGNVYRQSPLGSSKVVGADAYKAYTGSDPVTTYFTANGSITNAGFHYAIGENPLPPVRVSQQANEVLVQPNTGKARVSQDAAEVLVQPNTGKARTSQIAVEVLVEIQTFTRISQASVEAAFEPDNQQARISQSSIEAAYQNNTQQARISQSSIEVVFKSTSLPHAPLQVIFID